MAPGERPETGPFLAESAQPPHSPPTASVFPPEHPPATPRRTRRGLSPAAGIALGVVLALVLAAGGLFAWRQFQQPPVQSVPTDQPLPARTWPSGVWTGGEWGAARVEAFGKWRGSPADTATVYPAYETWEELADSDWHVSVFDGFEGKLVYGLPLLPRESAGRGLEEVAAGDRDEVFNSIADVLIKHGREDSYIRVGLEANGDWFPWGVGNGDNNPESFKAAFRHVAQLLKERMPEAQIEFDNSCGAVMRGQSDRMDPLTQLYPGDDVVDVIGCDQYDHYTLISHTEEQFTESLTPAKAAGMQDMLDFAKEHGKKFAVPEWGVVSAEREGGGDNAYFIWSMYRFFAENAEYIAFENYFNEPADYLGSSIWDDVQNPKAAAEYKQLW